MRNWNDMGIVTQVARALALGILMSSVASCMPQFIGAGPTGGVGIGPQRLGWYTKKVIAKRPPEALIASDGTICRVAPDRFADTRVGAAVHCNWQ